MKTANTSAAIVDRGTPAARTELILKWLFSLLVFMANHFSF